LDEIKSICLLISQLFSSGSSSLPPQTSSCRYALGARPSPPHCMNPTPPPLMLIIGIQTITYRERSKGFGGEKQRASVCFRAIRFTDREVWNRGASTRTCAAGGPDESGTNSRTKLKASSARLEVRLRGFFYFCTDGYLRNDGRIAFLVCCGVVCVVPTML
jgi:hypothetical protein